MCVGILDQPLRGTCDVASAEVREFAHRLPSGRAEAKGTSPTSSADLSTSASDKETSPTGAADLSTSASDASSENGETQQPPSPESAALA